EKEASSDGATLRGGNLTSLSTKTAWNVLALSSCQTAVLRQERRASRSREQREANGSWGWAWTVRARGGCEAGCVAMAAGSGAAWPRPATNMTGASCASSSMGYEFIPRVWPLLKT